MLSCTRYINSRVYRVEVLRVIPSDMGTFSTVLQWAQDLDKDRNLSERLSISSNFAVINNYDNLIVINHQENWHLSISVCLRCQIKISNLRVVQDVNFIVSQVHLQGDFLFFALRQCSASRLAFSLKLVKLPLLKSYTSTGVLAWQDFKERIEWDFDKQYPEMINYVLSMELSSCNFAWAIPRHNLALIAYAVLTDKWGRYADIRVWAFEASFDTTSEELVFRQSPASGPVAIPVAQNGFDTEFVGQSSLYFFEAIGEILMEDGLNARVAVHIALDDDGEIYFRYPPLMPPPELQHVCVYLADAYSGAYIFHSFCGIEIVYP